MRIQRSFPPVAGIYLPLAGGNMSGWVDMMGNTIYGLAVPTLASQAVGYAIPGYLAMRRKTANETVNNSAVLQNDDHLVWPLAVNAVWAFTCVLFGAIKALSKLKLNWVVPAGASGYMDNLLTASANGLDAVPHGTSMDYGCATDGDFVVLMHGVVINGANAGNLQLQWAQKTATVEDTIIYRGSILRVNRLE